ncbi:MAG: Seryl-tRNA synthetase [Candidatus Gottesmanbacteria bacterium GW2011_GWA1_47_8]|uniref:Serine--tRNA ligase n=1 Tax=Candidatus Gottesmanbacteria bacterium GW2011_GWA1_47_8 TaxID=1618438 RepID=A0A0G1TGZ8_9BACT|nr:MAG: Seryl-tRNA synthetase [Candidatus Gottesmanbacteria bacterium GW2011_GWA1_47_8]
MREHADEAKKAAVDKNLHPEAVSRALELDEQRRQLITRAQALKQERNQINTLLKSKRSADLIKQSVELKQKLADIEPQLKQVEAALGDLMLQIPNIPLPEVPIGKDSRDNKQVHQWGEKPKFDFKPRDHVELGKKLDILDLERGAKVAGFRGYFLKNDGVRLVMGLMRFALDKLVVKGFSPMMPPVIDRRSAFVNTGHFPWGEKEAYKLDEDETDSQNDYFLAGTAEVPLVSYYAGEILNEKELPIKLAGFSPCFRREIGNYGKDTKGIFRVHEFYKIEQVVICRNDIEESRRQHEEMLAISEEILQDLGLHYRVLLMCTGDMGEPQAKKYDLETWMPGRGDWGETGSDSIMTDFQSRRANIRYRAKEGLKFVHLLNNTAAPSARLVVAVLENYQQADGSVKLPAALVPYVGAEVISPK